MDDPFIREHIEELLKNIRTEVSCIMMKIIIKLQYFLCIMFGQDNVKQTIFKQLLRLL